MGCFFVSNNSKKIKSAGLISANNGLFRCPLCSGAMELILEKSLQCTNHHTFDLSRQGYVNVLSHGLKTKYDKQMFESRRSLYKSGVFQPLVDQIGGRIIREHESTREPLRILDAGCGEGSHLFAIREKIVQSSPHELLAVGADIAKEGIYLASRDYPDMIWCVADIANCPFASQQFHFILAILSPSNYAECQRMLKDDGMVIKVIPESGYLQELRAIFYEQSDKQLYANDNTVARFTEAFELVESERLKYSWKLEKALVEPLIRMTPLSWGCTEEDLQKAKDMDISEITIDLRILYGKKK
ncbi:MULTISPECIES: putative RNA methyltransferase [Brevibacillus]|jgi:23S rRNA (guanine745-N1)-methyltransferase|nr:methyltransferase domain-containing protein [Brevibacillus borstelensis]MBE5394010.1 methyltransferase domain-containing protein [Brevibacillus borstelensis]